MKSDKTRLLSVVFLGTPMTFNDPMPAATGASLYGLRVINAQGPIELDGNSFSTERGQWDANKILPKLAEIRGNGGTDFVLGITEADLYVQGANFVFGLADPRKGAAVVSLHRLRDSATGRTLGERIYKEVAHELGHLVGLGHCENPACIMSFARTVQDVDARLPYLCQSCASRVEQNKL
ncbi:MAG: archaemetzincin family Zn-dependent metalloprotease [Nitrososphaerota archaeon]|nr:archaemetzincin family Zn-dependent metalloprotease [Nitrososphaerota archaeon]